MQDCCIYQGLESGTSNRCELEGSILSAGEVELMPRLLDLLATQDADENMKNARRALWKHEQAKSEDEISPIQGSSARSKPKSRIIHDGMVAWWGWLSPMEHPHHPPLLGLQLSFMSGDLGRRFLPAADRAGALSVYTPHYGVRIMLVTGPSQSKGSIPCGLFCLRVWSWYKPLITTNTSTKGSFLDLPT